MSFSLIPSAMAASTSGSGTAGHTSGGSLGFILMWVALLAVLYFLMWRPQSKRMKEQRKMLASLKQGDEVATTGGIIGRITSVSEDFIMLSVANNLELKVQKQAVTLVLPRGSVKAT